MFIYCIQFSDIARKLNTAVSLCFQQGPSCYDKEGAVFFSPILFHSLSFIADTQTHTHTHTHTFSARALQTKCLLRGNNEIKRRQTGLPVTLSAALLSFLTLECRIQAWCCDLRCADILLACRTVGPLISAVKLFSPQGRLKVQLIKLTLFSHTQSIMHAVENGRCAFCLKTVFLNRLT